MARIAEGLWAVGRMDQALEYTDSAARSKSFGCKVPVMQAIVRGVHSQPHQRIHGSLWLRSLAQVPASNATPCGWLMFAHVAHASAGRVLHAQGKAAAAAEALESAVTGAGTLGAPLWELRALEALAEHEAEAGHAGGEAWSRLQTAAHGMRGSAAQIRQLLAPRDPRRELLDLTRLTQDMS